MATTLCKGKKNLDSTMKATIQMKEHKDKSD